tara:strand:+ start:436 stop:747 length:312 start_codon:yes stop_codon:yes gene_type:complete
MIVNAILFKYSYRLIPEKPRKAIEIRPVKSILIPTPLRVGGTLEYLILFLIVARETIAKKKPNPDPNPYTVASARLYSLSTRNKEQPNMEQFTVIKGRNIPRL